MSVLLVIDHFGSGGAQRQLVALAVGLAKRGHHVECISYHAGYDFFRPALAAAGVAVHVVPKRGRLGANVVAAIRRRLVAGRFRAIVAFMETPSVYAELASAGLPVRVIVSERVDPLGATYTPMLRARALLHRRADAVVANSATSRDIWTELFPGLASRFCVIRNGVDLAHFAPAPAPSSDSPLRLVAVGTVVERKNAHGLAEALAVLRARGLPLPVVTWVGKTEPGQATAAYRARLDRQLAEDGLEQHWVWAGEQRDVRPYIEAAHALIHPSFREGLSNAVCEAFACARPAIAAAVGDTTWMLGGERRGTGFDPLDVPSIADALQRFAALGPDERRARGAAARAFAEKELGFERFVERFEALLVGCATPRPAQEAG
ncbi:MAG: glycosyltransferase [Steroidobacteraceae bacterium]|nr:glycosyltransferase [Steroidobacteraceae bacterium]